MLATINDKKLATDDGNGEVAYYESDVVTANDYYPFGMIMPGRKYAALQLYRYGFNGKENDNEVKGEGGQQDYGMRIYDPRVGRFLSVDPLSKDFPWNSVYAFAENDVIQNVDLDGGEKKPFMGIGAFKNSSKTWLETLNGTTIMNFTEFGNKYRVAEYSTKLSDEGYYGRQYQRKLYFVQDKTMVNNSDYEVGDGSVIRTAGTNWHFWMSNNDLSTQMKQTNSVTRGFGTAAFGFAAIGTAAPLLVKAGATYWGSKLINTGIDFTSQMIANGGNLDNINVTSLFTSFVLNKTTSFGGLLGKNFIANGFQVNSGGGYQGFFGKGVHETNIFYNIGVGTIFDKASVALQGLNGNETRATLTRWNNLSYKPKYKLLLQRYDRNQKIGNFFNSPITQIVTGAINNATAADVKESTP